MTFRWKKLGDRSNSKWRYAKTRLQLESLEDRINPTSTLYLDFGDNFPSGGFELTVEELRDDIEGPNLASSRFDYDDSDTIRMNPLSSLIDFDYNGIGGVGDNDDYTDLRAAIVSLVERYYVPFDANVVIAPALDNTSSATYLADIQATLDLGANTTGERDTWVFIAELLNTDEGNESVGDAGSLNGLAPGEDQINDVDDSVLVFADSILDGDRDETADTRFGYTAAHEAAHAFGLDHTWNGEERDIEDVNTGTAGNASFEVDSDITDSLVVGETFTVSGSTGNDGTYTIRAGSSFNGGTGRTIINVDEAVSDGTADGEIEFDYNTNAFLLAQSDLIVGSADNESVNRKSFVVFTRFPLTSDNAAPAFNNEWNNYDLLSDPDLLGPRANGPAYVTGTGAFDIIEITRVDATTADVSVEAFRDAGFTDSIETFTYQIDYTDGVLVESGFNADRIIIDSRLGVAITVRGMSDDDDELVVEGHDAATGTYEPGADESEALDDETYVSGTVTVGSTTIDIEEFEGGGFTTGATVRVRNIDEFTFRSPGDVDDLRITSQTGGRNRIDGTVNNGTGVAGLVIENITDFIVNTGNNDNGGADEVDIDDPLVASGLQNLTINTGDGADILSVDITNFSLPTAGGSFEFNGGSGDDTIDSDVDISFTLTDTELTSSVGGTVDLDSVELATLNGGASANTFDVSNWTGTADLDGQSGSDAYLIELLGSGNGRTNINDTGASGTDTSMVAGTNGMDLFTIKNSEVQLGNEIVDFNVSLEELTINAGDGDDDLTVDNSMGLVTSTAIIINGEGDTNTLNIQGDPGITVLRETHAIEGARNGEISFDPDDSAGPGGVGAGADSEHIIYDQIDIINDIKPAEQLDVFFTTASANAILVSDGNDFNGVTTTRISDSIPILQFGNKGIVTLSGLDGEDTFTVENPNAADGLQSLEIYGNVLPNVAFADDDTADTFDIRAFGAAISAFGEGGGDTFILQGDGFGDEAFFSGGDGNDTFTINAGAGVTANQLSFAGDAGADTAFINGRAVNDSARVRLTDLTGGSIVEGLGLPFNFATLEDFRYDGQGGQNSFAVSDEHSAGTNGGLNWIYRPTAANAGQLFLDAMGPIVNPVFTFTNINDELTVNGDGDGSGDRGMISVLGVSTNGFGSGNVVQEILSSNGSDEIFASDLMVSIDNQALGQLLPIHFEENGNNVTFSSVAVRAGNEPPPVGDDITATPSKRLLLFIDGMDPAFGVPGDSLEVEIQGTQQFSRVTNSKFGAHTRITDSATGASVGYIHIESIANAGVKVAAAGPGAGPHVRVYDAKGQSLRFDFMAYNPAFTGGVHVAAGDINGDAIPDIVTAPASAGGPHIKVFDGISGELIREFFAYDPGFTGGVYVAVGYVNPDGFGEIITGAGQGGGPHVRIFDGNNGNVLHDLFVYAPQFTGGVRVAAGDINGDGLSDIITGAGPGGGPHVRAHDAANLASLLRDFMAYDPSVNSGVFVAAGDVTGDFRADIIIGPSIGGPHLRVFNGATHTLVSDFFVNDPFAPASIPRFPIQSGLRVGVADTDGDKILEVVVGRGPGLPSRLFSYDLGPAEIDNFFVFDPTFGPGLFVAGSR